METYIRDTIRISNRLAPYKIITANNYFEGAKHTESMEKLIKSGVYTVVNHIMALKQSRYVLRKIHSTNHKLVLKLLELTLSLIHELREKFNFVFDNEFVENY